MVNINNISDILNFRYDKKYLKLKYWGEEFPQQFENYSDKLESEPEVYQHFRYILHTDIKVNKLSRNDDVFCYSDHQHLIADLVNMHSGDFGTLVIMGEDKHLSETISDLRPVRDRFSKIFYEAKDVDCDWIRTLPMGMIMSYMIRNGGSDILKPINSLKDKKKLAACAFGSKYPWLTKKIGDRKNLRDFTRRSDFIDDIFCEPLKYYDILSEYRYFLSPLGNGIQTPKICECIMCEVIPVVTDHVAHRELRDLHGLPLLVVKDWPNVTEKYLRDQWEQVYSLINWNKYKAKYLVKNFRDLLEA